MRIVIKLTGAQGYSLRVPLSVAVGGVDPSEIPLTHVREAIRSGGHVSWQDAAQSAQAMFSQGYKIQPNSEAFLFPIFVKCPLEVVGISPLIAKEAECQ